MLRLIRTAQFRLHFIVFLWGFTAIFGKLISLEAHMLTWYRTTLTAFFLFVFVFLFQKNKSKVGLRLLLQLLGVGCLMTIHWVLFFLSIKTSNVSIALSCMSTSTIFTAFIEPVIYRRKIDWFEVGTGLIIMSCMILIFNTNLNYKEGILYGILCAFLGALFSVLNGKMFGRTSSGNIIFWEIFGGAILLTVVYLCTGQLQNFSAVSFKDLFLLVLLAGVFTAFPMFQSISLMKYISPFTLILTVNLEPVYGIILAYFIFGDSEHMSFIFYIASIVMLFAIISNGILKTRQKLKEEKRVPSNIGVINSTNKSKK